MKFSVIALVFCACVWVAAADVAHIKAAKAKLIGRLAGKGRHHKRGILSAVPPFKLGHDIPHVTHSVLKPLVVNYPPTAAVAAVKIPIPHPHFPVPVGHKVPGLPHPHYGLKFPHTKFVAKPDHHYHHHHHHVSPRPIIPVVPAAPIPATHVAPAAHIIPAPRPSVAVAHPPPITHPLPIPAPPVPVFPHNNLHLKPLLPAAAIPLASAPVLPSPVLPLSQPFPYVIRPGGAVQTSLFATYPRYPFINSYQAPLLPVGPAPPVWQDSISQVLLQRPQLNPYHFIPQAAGQHGIIEQHTPNVVAEQTPGLFHPTQVAPQPSVHLHSNHEVLQQPAFHLHSTEETLHQPGFHLHPTQEGLPQPGYHLHPTQETIQQPGYHLQPGQEVLPQPGFHLHPTQETLPQPNFNLHPSQEPLPQPGFHLHPSQVAPQSPIPLQPTQPSIPLDHDGWSPVPAQPQDLGTSHEGHFPQHTHFTQEQGTQVYEHHTDNNYNDYQHQLQHHIQQQLEQAQYEQSLSNQHQPSQDYGAPQQLGQEYGQPNEYSQQDQDFAQHAQEYPQHGHDFKQHQQEFSQNGQDFAQHAQDFGHNLANLGQEYGLPHQGAEGRNSDDSEQQQFHNHIPLGLQPPIDRPLDHFQ